MEAEEETSLQYIMSNMRAMHTHLTTRMEVYEKRLDDRDDSATRQSSHPRKTPLAASWDTFADVAQEVRARVVHCLRGLLPHTL